MAGLNREAETALLRGLGAYLRDVPRNELPPRLRPLAGRHQKMLVARKKEVLDALDDGTLRALIVQWLDDDPPLARADAELLRLAAGRPDGWEERLGGKVERKPRSAAKAAPDASSAVAREKEKARKARDESRKLREDLERVRQGAKARIAALEAELAVTKIDLAGARKELQSAMNSATKARDELERETRKARRRIADAQSDEKAARKDLQRALRDLEKVRAPRAEPKKKTRPARVVASEPAKRTALPVPKGRFEDAPETLRAWLEEPDTHLLVDGYNVSKAPEGYGELELHKQRERVVQAAGKLARRFRISATVVFDGADVPPGGSRRSRGPVAVEYSRPDETADDHLVAKLGSLPKHPVVVVTNDRELQARARALGATIATSNQFLGLIRS